MGRTAIISVDGHVKASRSVYREYVEQKYRDAYDTYVETLELNETPDAGNLHPDLAAEVQWSSDLRIARLEQIGVVAEVLFPNGVPFQLNRLDDHARFASFELGGAGRRAYNRWLVDFCAEAPERRRGQMLTSFADVDAAVADVHWAHANGLGGVMLPELTRESRTFLDPALDPIWAACQETGLPISAHGGASIPDYGEASFAALLTSMAENGFFSNRSLWMLIAGGVFDRFPELRVCYVETQAYIVVAALRQMDSVMNPRGDWMAWAKTQNAADTTKRRPSEYLGRNVFVGVSPFSRAQISMDDLLAKDEGRRRPGTGIGVEAALFGVDFPQLESIHDRCIEEVSTLLSAPLVTDGDAEAILMGNAARVYGFDLAALAPHVARAGFALSDVRESVSHHSTQLVTKAPFMGSAAARSGVSV